MSFFAALSRASGVHVWLARNQSVLGSDGAKQGQRPVPYLQRQLGLLGAVSSDDRLQAGWETAAYTLTIPYIAGKEVQPGDVVLRCLGRDGRDHVLGGKAWAVLGRRVNHDDAELQLQTLYCAEGI